MSKALTGKWQWNGEIKPMYAMDHGLEHYVWFKSGFKSNGQRYEGIRFIFDEFWRLEYTAWSGYVGAGEGHYAIALFIGLCGQSFGNKFMGMQFDGANYTTLPVTLIICVLVMVALVPLAVKVSKK